MSKYIISVIINGNKLTLEKTDEFGVRRFRKGQAKTIKAFGVMPEYAKHNPHYVIEQAYETHVREFSKKRQDWIAYVNTEFADAWEDDPCLGCGGVGGGWVRECPNDCSGRYWHERMNEIAEFGNRYTPKTIW